MIDPQVGDYVISTNQIYEISDVYKINFNTFYNLRRIENPADILDMMTVIDEEIMCINLSRLRHLGEIVKKDEASKAIEVLFRNS